MTSRLGKLNPEGVAAFSASCAERLSNFYEYFSRKESWGDYPLLRGLLDSLWEYLGGRAELAKSLRSGVQKIEPLMPHADDFLGLASLCAVDFGICLDSAIRWAVHEPEAGLDAPQYALEGIRAIATKKETGKSSIGDPIRRQAVEKQLSADAAIVSELEAQAVDLSILEKATHVDKCLVEEIRQRAMTRRYNAAVFFRG